MSDLFDKLENRRAIIDRRALSARLDEIAGETSDTGKRRRAMVDLLKEALEAGRAEIELRLLAHPSSGRVAANATRSEEHTSELQSLMRITSAILCFQKKNKSNNT